MPRSDARAGAGIKQHASLPLWFASTALLAMQLHKFSRETIYQPPSETNADNHPCSCGSVLCCQREACCTSFKLSLSLVWPHVSKQRGRNKSPFVCKHTDAISKMRLCIHMYVGLGTAMRLQRLCGGHAVVLSLLRVCQNSTAKM